MTSHPSRRGGASIYLFTVLLALYLLLSEVFGVSLEFHPFPA